MLKHIMGSETGKESYWYEIHTQADLLKYIDYAKELAHTEFRAMIRLSDRGLSHNTWKSPISNMSIYAHRYWGKSLIVAFAENEAGYFNQMTDGLTEYGVIFISANGGYNFSADVSDAVETIEIDKIEVNLITITTGTTNLILENDIAIEEDLLDYMESNEIPFSSVIQLRLAISNGDLLRAISLIRNGNNYDKLNLYVKTTAQDVEQIWKLLDKLKDHINEIHASIPDSADELWESLIKDYPEIKFIKLDLSEVMV